jgi:hypothetical protein
MAHYTVKPSQETVNEKLARAVYDKLHQTQPTALRYTTFRFNDGQTFVHVTADETPGQRNPLLEVAAFRRFSNGIADRCEIPPQTAEADQIGG